jgi:hypothetical protein|tara:strand:+ start:341 stop:469 length:129 start_codon:yes stop_codon:yes gene_type:complete
VELVVQVLDLLVVLLVQVLVSVLLVYNILLEVVQVVDYVQVL